MLSVIQHSVITIFLSKQGVISDEGDLACVLCGQLREFWESYQLICNLIARAKDGMSSFDGIEPLLRLRRLPCKQCLEAMHAVSVLTSCGRSRLLRIGDQGQNDGTFYTEQN